MRSRRGDDKAAYIEQPGSKRDEVAKDAQPQPSPLALLLILHTILAAATRTFFQPDEYWQSLEIAHRIVFGYGYKTWEWKAGGSGADSASLWQYIVTGPIRSVVHPALFVPVYWLLDCAGLDQTFLLTMAPRLVQGLLSAASAHKVFLLARDLGGARVAWAALLSMIVSPYYLYTAARTFANTAEASLTVFALRRALQVGRGSGTKAPVASLAFAACACLIRPTNAVLWVFVYGCISWRLLAKTRYAALGRLVGSAFAIGLIAIAFSAAVDSAYHGRLTLPFIPFVLTNIYHSLSLFYGSHPWHWYLSQGLPVIGMVSLPFMVIGGARWLRAGTGGQRLLVGTVLWTIGAYSLLGHKEWRFLQPIVPLLHVLAGVSLASNARAPSSSRNALSHLFNSTSLRNRLLLLATLPLSIYLVAFHCIAQSSTLPSWIRREHAAGSLDSVGFLMPCHSTPWQSHIHSPGLEGRMWFISCEPPTPSEATDVTKPYMDESDFFYEDPVEYLQTYLPPSASEQPPASGWDRELHPSFWQSSGAYTYAPAHNWPSHIALFDALLQDPRYGQDVQRLLAQQGYFEVTRMWNSLFHDDERRRGYIVILARREVEDYEDASPSSPSSSSSLP